MASLSRFIFIIFLSIATFTLGWILRGFFSLENEKSSYNTDIIRMKKETPFVPKIEEVVQPIPIKQETALEPQPLQEKQNKQEDKYKDRNRKQFATADDTVFSARGAYSFLVNGFGTEDKALKYIKNLKKRFPSWSLLLKSETNLFKIYLGPFETKRKANQFINELEQPLPVPNYFLEEQSL